MRKARLKIAPEVGSAVYHCISRVVNGERLIDDRGKEVLRKQLRQIADYSGVQIITFAVMTNHFHVLLRVPKKAALSDKELLRRHHVLYPKPTRFQANQLDRIREQLPSNGPLAQAWRQRQSAMMGDVSAFMKLVKQRFSIWYNRNHQRFGTLWAERFKSALVEPSGRAVQAVARYVDLNPVRAGLVNDPADYRFCGYGEACAGVKEARRGIGSIMDVRGIDRALASYRIGLFGKAAQPRAGAAAVSRESFDHVAKTGGKIPLADCLRRRIRFFSDGVVVGSRSFLAAHAAQFKKLTDRKFPPKFQSVSSDSGIMILRGLRGAGIE